MASFDQVFPNDQITSVVIAPGYEFASGLLSVHDSDVNESIILTPLTGITDMEGGQFRFYPNPAEDRIYIEIPRDAVVTILDMSGRPVLTREIPGGISTVPVYQLEPGSYLIRVQSGSQVITSRLMVE